MLQDNAALDVRLAQLDRAFGYGPKGRGFESSNARDYNIGNPLKKQGFPIFLLISNCYTLLH